MITEPSVEYFYGETLRWSFGFDNPNKAAVIFACLLPLLFYGWDAGWKIRNIWLRTVTCFLAGAAFLLAGYCLCMTFSRGALVAVVPGIGYVVVFALLRDRGKPVGKWIAHFLLLGAFAFLVVWTGLGARSGEAAAGDRSVGNRFDVWSAALQMSVENPAGFGAGRSGLEYMQWYQATDREEGYRTMVNSYLTFLVEYGWGWFALIVVVFSCFWGWTAPGREERFVTGLRGVLIAFLVAGVFSTTMEEWRLWILPCLAFAALLVTGFRRKVRKRKASLAVALGIAVACILILVGTGLGMSSRDSLHREFGAVAGGSSVSRVVKKGSEVRDIGIMPDTQVLGEFHGKLLRDLALAGHSGIVLGEGAALTKRVMLVGRGVDAKLPDQTEDLFLLAPGIVDESSLEKLKGTGSKVRMILGEFDEHGRGAFWKEVADGEGWEVTELSGVGTRVDWSWEEIAGLLEE